MIEVVAGRKLGGLKNTRLENKKQEIREKQEIKLQMHTTSCYFCLFLLQGLLFYYNNIVTWLHLKI